MPSVFVSEHRPSDPLETISRSTLTFEILGSTARRKRPNVRIASRIRKRVDQLRMPYTVTIQDFHAPGLRFEISNPVERHRVVEHGGETDYLHTMLNALRPDDVLYDVGVCVGLVALHAAARCRVIGFEPDPSFFERVSRNLTLNPNLVAKLYPYAISDENTTLPLFTDGPAGNSPSLRHQRGEYGEVRVTSKTLDTLVFDDGLPPPTAIKLDIEGAELPALRGARRLLQSEDLRPRLLFLEVHDALLPAFGGTADDVRRIVNDVGYHATYEAQRGGQTHYVLEI